MKCFVITFPSVFHAFHAEKLLKQNSISVKLIPIPRELSGCCEGLAAKIDKVDVAKAVPLLEASGVAMVYKGIEVDV